MGSLQFERMGTVRRKSGKGTSKARKDFEAWLVGFEKQAGQPVIVGLLVESGKISFYSVHNLARFFDRDGDGDEDNDGDGGELPSVDLPNLTKSEQVVIDWKDFFVG